MLVRGFWQGALALAAAVAGRAGVAAQQKQRFLYAALPGVGGGNNLKFGGAGILVFDIDHGHKFVKRIPLQGAAPADGRQESIKGIARTRRPRGSTCPRVAASPRTIC